LSELNYTDKYTDMFSKKYDAKGQEIIQEDDFDDKLYDEYRKSLDQLQIQKELTIVSFEKDDDTNHHIAWIHYTSLLRCRN